MPIGIICDIARARVLCFGRVGSLVDLQAVVKTEPGATAAVTFPPAGASQVGAAEDVLVSTTPVESCAWPPGIYHIPTVCPIPTDSCMLCSVRHMPCTRSPLCVALQEAQPVEPAAVTGVTAIKSEAGAAEDIGKHPISGEWCMPTVHIPYRRRMYQSHR